MLTLLSLNIWKAQTKTLLSPTPFVLSFFPSPPLYREYFKVLGVDGWLAVEQQPHPGLFEANSKAPTAFSSLWIQPRRCSQGTVLSLFTDQLPRVGDHVHSDMPMANLPLPKCLETSLWNAVSSLRGRGTATNISTPDIWSWEGSHPLPGVQDGAKTTRASGY